MNLKKMEKLYNTVDEVAEWLRRWTANPMDYIRVGSNPILVLDFTQKGCRFDCVLLVNV